MDVSLVRANAPSSMPCNGAATTTTTNSTGNAIPKNGLYNTFQLIATGGGATAIIEVTNDLATAQGTASNWILLGTIALANAGTDGFAYVGAWGWVRVRFQFNFATCKVLMGC